MKEILNIRSVCECNHKLGCKTLHPMISIINLEHTALKHEAVAFDFYTILLIKECDNNCCCCGRKYYDYSDSTMVFLKPGDNFSMSNEKVLPEKGWLLAFHPALFYHTQLKSHIEDYTFFSYSKEEALHLSARETATVTCCLNNIEGELHHSIDKHTATILSRHIELLLDYCTRFYERQFITQENKNKIILEKLSGLIDDYMDSGMLYNSILPTSEFCAKKLGLSESYFNDLLKFETGKTLYEYFECKRLEAARKMLDNPMNTPAAVARRLGYSNVQYFSLIFKKIIGVSPNEYRFLNN